MYVIQIKNLKIDRQIKYLVIFRLIHNKQENKVTLVNKVPAIRVHDMHRSKAEEKESKLKYVSTCVMGTEPRSKQYTYI